MKKILITIMAVVMALGLTQLNAFAERKHGMGHHDYKKMSMNDRFFMKVKMIKKHQEEIGVTDDQMHQMSLPNQTPCSWEILVGHKCKCA